MIYEEGEDDEYTYDDLRRDMEAMRIAGIIEVTGISDDGQWVYSITDFGRKMYDEIQQADAEAVAKMLDDLFGEHEDKEF